MNQKNRFLVFILTSIIPYNLIISVTVVIIVKFIRVSTVSYRGDAFRLA